MKSGNIKKLEKLSSFWETDIYNRFNDKKGHNKGEYLLGFYKEDRICPVVTLVIHFGADEWDGPLSLYDMMDLKNEKLLEYVQDYRIFLIDPYKLTNNELKKFSSSLGNVLGYIKYSKDKKALSKFLNDNQVMIIDNDAARVIRDITNTPIYVPDGKGEIDMCKAVKEMIDESKVEGRILTLIELVRDGSLDIEKAAEKANMTIEEFKKLI